MINGKLIAKEKRLKLKDEVKNFKRKPRLDVICVGDNPASMSYVKGKEKACLEVGIECHTHFLDETISQIELIMLINDLNNDNDVDGILVQLPLPKHFNEELIIETINPEKDVDGFTPLNVAALHLGKPLLVPCTPKGIIELIESVTTIEGKNAVVIGRSQIVGQPVAKLLLDKNATVTIAHSKTKDLAAVCRQADILVVAVGRPGLVTSDYVKDGATVIDVGINRVNGKIVGDCDETVKTKTDDWTPVPGGVGPMTIACLIENTFACFKRKFNIN